MRILVAIPVYNEAPYLPRVLAAVSRYARDILVINDGSTDSTAGLLAEFPHVATITHIENRGYGQSLIDAFAYAQRAGYDWVVTMDCDEQHEPAQLPEFFAAAARNDVDLISGSRYLAPHPDDDEAPRERRRINFLINNLLEQLLGLKLTDSFCGFKAHRVAAMRALCLDEPGYAFPLQFWPRFARAGMKMREIPVRRIYRDTQREFGGTLDDPEARLLHYVEVLLRALTTDSAATKRAPTCTLCACPESR